MTGQSLGSLPLSLYKVIATYKPKDTTIAKVLLYLRKSGGAIAYPAPLVPMPMHCQKQQGFLNFLGTNVIAQYRVDHGF